MTAEVTEDEDKKAGEINGGFIPEMDNKENTILDTLTPNVRKTSNMSNEIIYSTPSPSTLRMQPVSVLRRTADGNDTENRQRKKSDLSNVDQESKRKVSIASDAIQQDMLDRQRKISSSSGRYKSILVYSTDNNTQLPHYHEPCRPCNYDEKDKHSLAYESIHTQNEYNSWWYLFCAKCRQKETGSGWEPRYWQSVCPYPFCPTYRHVARIFALILLGLLLWGIIFSVLGSEAAPHGQLFHIALLCIVANIGGWLFRIIAMPPLVGMLLVGIIFQNIGLINVQGPYEEFVAELRKIALVVILTRAGLDLDAGAMKRLCWTVLRMGLIPWLLECGIICVLTHFLLDLPWMWGLLLGAIVAAVSPAVVVPCLIRLRNKGYGVAKGIPTLIIAVSGIDDATSVAVFGILHSIMFLSNSLVFEIVLGPLSIIVGIGFGILWGILARYVPEKDDPFVVPLRILLLLGGGLIAVMGSEHVGLGGAGPLGCIAAAFLSCCAWSSQGWDVEDNPVATAFEIFWMIFEPILFGLTGTQIKISELDQQTFFIGLAILSIGVVLRIILTCLIAFGASLNWKEKIFIGISWMAKASVQAALGPVALDVLRDQHHKTSSSDKKYAEIVLMICVMSILITAPIGAILITVTGSKLLTKTAPPVIPIDGWRRSARPSLRDISIINEEIEDDDDNNEEKNKNNSEIPAIVISDQPKSNTYL